MASRQFRSSSTWRTRMGSVVPPRVDKFSVMRTHPRKLTVRKPASDRSAYRRCLRSSCAQQDAHQRAVDLQVAVVFDEAQLPEFVHEETHARTRRADDFGQRLLTDPCRDRLRTTVLAKIRPQKKRACQPLFAGVEKLVHQIFLDPAVARQQMRH